MDHMTYCCAWIHDNHLFAIADAAITSPSGVDDQVMTSFTERRSDSKGSFVTERALKLVPIQSSVISYAGDCRVGNAIIEVFAREMLNDCDPMRSLETAIRSVQPVDVKIDVLLGFHDRGTPQVIVSRNCRTPNKMEAGCSVHLGSMPWSFKSLTNTLLSRASDNPMSPVQELTSVLALVQSYGVSNYLMDYGVGGTCCGVVIGPDGKSWQPDTLYFLIDAQLTPLGGIGVFVRDNVLVSIGSQNTGTRVFCNTTNASGSLDHLESIARLANHSFDNLIFDYVVFINVSSQVVTLVEMRKQREHDLVALKTICEEGSAKVIGVYAIFRSELQQQLLKPVRMNGQGADFSLKHFKYKAPTHTFPTD